MEFLNTILLGGLAAASIPFIIYLFNRSRFKVEKWGAMHLLDAAMAVNRRRIKVEQLLLILLRALIPGILALCMARPVITGMQSLIHNSKSSAVILLDNSFSMEGGDSIESNFAIATREASRVLDTLPRGSQAAVIGMAGPLADQEASGYDLNQSRKVLESAWGSYGTAKVDEALEQAGVLITSSMHHADRQLLIVSDFQRSSWSEKESVARSRAMELIQSAPVKPRVILMNVGRDVKENIALEGVRLSRSIVGVQQQVKIRANVHNYGKNAYHDLRVYLRVDGAGRSVSQVSIGPGESTQVLFSHRFDVAGSHIIEINTDADRLRADNSCRLSIPVVDRLPVLIVDGDPSAEPLQAETAFLQLALRPFKAAKMELRDMIVPKVVAEHDFKASLLQKTKVLVLANVSSLSDAELKATEEFVRNGGGLLVFPGDQIDLAWYQQKLARVGGLLPMRIGQISGDAQGKAEATIVNQHYEHPALEIFNDPRNGDMSGAQIRLSYRLLDTGSKTDREARRVLAKLDSGNPFLVEKDFGHGRVILCNIPIDATWSNLPLRPFYLPLMQQLVTYVASKVHPPRNIMIEEPIAAFLPLEEAGKRATLTDPNGVKHQLQIRKGSLHGIIEFTETKLPGVYLLESPSGRIIHYVVSTPLAESNVERLSDDEMERLAEAMSATIVNSYQDYREIERKRRFGQELWVALLWLALIAVFGELFLVQYLSRRKAQ